MKNYVDEDADRASDAQSLQSCLSKVQAFLDGGSFMPIMSFLLFVTYSQLACACPRDEPRAGATTEKKHHKKAYKTFLGRENKDSFVST